MISGFRIAPGGAQELTGVLPDLTVLGKVLGGGLPAAAYGGSLALMSQIAPAGDVYQAGTLSGNPLAVAAGRAALELLDEEAYLTLSATTAALADGLREAAGDRPVSVVHTTGLLTVFFAEEPPRDYAGAAACDTEAYGAWCRALLARGVYPPPSQFEAWFPSLAHTGEHVDPHGRGRRGGVRRGRGIAWRRFPCEFASRTSRGAMSLDRPRGPRARRAARPRGRPRLVRRRLRRARRRPAPARPATRTTTRCWSRRSTRATSCTTRAGRVVRPEDPDLSLLAGDRLYALGLARLAELGDLEAVAELADVISLAAQAHAEGDADRAAAIWEAGVRAVGDGPRPDHEATKAAWRGAR